MLASELGKLPNTVSIEGHTDAKPFAAGTRYGNWELSADRANAARRVMQAEWPGGEPGHPGARATPTRSCASRPSPRIPPTGESR